MNVALHVQKEHDEAAGRVNCEFLANMSQEPRTPLHGICGDARFGMRETGSAELGRLRHRLARMPA